MPVFSLEVASTTMGGPGLEEELGQAEDDWLRAFHAGQRDCLERCYREQWPTVERAVATIIATGADRETLVHEVFFRLLNEESLRRGFHGGSFSAWLRVVARNQAIDYARRRRLEVQIPNDAHTLNDSAAGGAPRSAGTTPISSPSRRRIDSFRATPSPSPMTGGRTGSPSRAPCTP